MMPGTKKPDIMSLSHYDASLSLVNLFSAVRHAFRLLLFHSLEQYDTACPVVLLAVIYVVCVRHPQSVRQILSTKQQKDVFPTG